MRYFSYLIFLFGVLNLQAQSKQVQIVDSLSLETIPFATVHFSNNKGLITDETGFFELLPEQVEVNDSLFVSSLGYDGLAVGLKQLQDSILYVMPQAIALDNVILTNKSYTSEKIIDLVQERLESNYSIDYSKKRLFLREYYTQNTKKLDINKYKTSIPELNRKLVDSFLTNMPRSNEYTIETLCNYGGDFQEDNQKINLLKARQTYDKGNDLMKSLNQRIETVLRDNVKTDSYFKVRSGIFGGKMDVDGLEKEVDSTNLEALKEFEKKRAENKLKWKNNFASQKKQRIAELYSELFFTKKAELNCIQKPNRYVFSEPELTFEGSDLTYVITYKPKGGEDFEGTLYINAEDFAVTRLDFNNVKPLFKLKLLGVSYNENLKSGRMIFSKNANNKYALSYLQMTSGSEIGVDRPLKFIEKNKFVKGRRKQNEISFRLDLAMVSIDQYELRVFDHESLTEEAFQAIEEKNDVLPKYHKEFTTNFWEEF